MPAAAIGAVASVAGGALAGHAAKKAAGKQADAANSATAEQQRQFDLINEQNAPYRQAGTAALNQLMGLYGLGGQQGGGMGPNGESGPIDASGLPIGGADPYAAFRNSPDYQFALQQGEQSLLRNRAALGGLQGGQTGAALQQFGQGLASQQLGNYRNSLMGLIGAGQNSANLTAQAGLQTGQNIGQNMLYGGEAGAAGTLARGNAWGGALGQLGGAAQQYFQNRNPLTPVDTSGLDPYRR